MYTYLKIKPFCIWSGLRLFVKEIGTVLDRKSVPNGKYELSSKGN